MGQREAIANAIVLYAPFAVGLILAVFTFNAWTAPLGFAWFTLALYVLGFALFLVAKSSLLRRGIRFSLGSARMSPWNRRLYRTGYALMVLGLFATISLIMVLGPSHSA